MSLSVWQRWTAGTVCALAMATAAYAQTTPYATINNPSGPVKNLFVGNDLSVQIDHQLDTSAFQIYPASTRPADYGTLIAVDNTLYTPDFSKHGGTATGGLGARTPFTAVSQTPPAGSGTVADPYRVTTVVDVGTSGLRISQNDSYVSGQDTYRTDITLQNTGAADKTLVLYRAMDCYLGASDSGYGAATAGGTISCTKNANNTPPGRVMSLIPLTAGSSYRQDGFSAIWSYISTKQPFDDNCVQLLHFGEIAERQFANWALGQVKLESLTPSLVLKYAESLPLTVQQFSARSAQAMLLDLVATASVAHQ